MQLLARLAFDVHHTRSSDAHDLSDSPVSVSLDRHGLGQAAQMTRIDTGHRQPNPRSSPYSQRESPPDLEPDARHLDPGRPNPVGDRLRLRNYGALPDNDAVLVDDADCHFLEDTSSPTKCLIVLLLFEAASNDRLYRFQADLLESNCNHPIYLVTTWQQAWVNHSDARRSKWCDPARNVPSFISRAHSWYAPGWGGLQRLLG